ncbi:ABC transporter permease [Chromatiales bacterium (ex Bugula neritina AB1)]|nr:ABC transporter permease [Chromatiales bacterium (ex Bugula neritina AB1)]
MSPVRLTGYRIFWIAILLITWQLSVHGRSVAKMLDARWLIKYPSAWKLKLKDHISAFMQWLVDDARLGPVSFIEFTRAISWLIEQPYNLALGIFSSGLVSGQGSAAIQHLPALSYIPVTLAVIALGHYTRDWLLAIIAGLAFTYLAVFSQWESAMVTLASIVIAVPLGVAIGLFLGIGIYQHPVLKRVINPLLDLMQTVPVFAYLVPVLFLFGFGPVSALIATIIYAMPPMARVTALSLQEVDSEIRELGLMAGCTKRQLMWKVLIPVARPGLMVGVNQVIMLSLNMVIIASMIGAGGLGYDVLASLRKLDIGAGIEAGVAIVVLAVALDRLSQAYSVRRKTSFNRSREQRFWQRYPRTVMVGAAVVICMLLGKWLPFLQTYPETLQITTGEFWQQQVRFINVNYFDQLEAGKDLVLSWFLLPVKRFLLGIPWPWGVVLVPLIAWHFGGWRLALVTALMTAFIAANGLWAKAMTTVYLCGASVIIASTIGIPMGILAATNEKAGKVIGVFIDTLQTLPSFVYLIPVVMLFRVGDFTAMIAVVLYALAPAVRYTAHGIRHIDSQLIEAGIVSGCSPRQLLTRIRLPLALPQILLGVNQTIMLALSMLVITALVGTRDLGQEVYIALTKADTGRGIVAGLCVAFIAIIADRIVTASADRASKRYRLEQTNNESGK